MPSDPLILGFDTSAAHCAAALLRGDQVLASTARDMDRGQAEHLMPLLENLLHSQNLTWQDLDAIGVGTGPGNFTGIRIGVSAARGLALGLNIPAVGVDGFDARRAALPKGAPITIPAPRGQIYVPGPPPRQEDAPAPPPPQPSLTDLATAIARLAAQRWQDAPPAPCPTYIRAADAAPARDRPPVLLDP